VVCNSGVGLTPTLEGGTYHFSAGGLYNGLVLLTDDETRSYWDHITGRAVHGALAGKGLAAWPLEYTTVEVALDRDPALQVSLSNPSLKAKAFGVLAARKTIGSRGFFPPGFRGTMGTRDERLDEHDQGLGVVVEGEARFYPSSKIGPGVDDEWGGRVLHVTLGPDRVPRGEWSEDGERPFQLFTRWYGFSYTYPGCGVRPG
jgi:hypothetical protein